VGEEIARRLGSGIDAIEVFNARTLFQGDSRSALAIAQELGLTTFVGSDAHTSVEYGRAVNSMTAFTDASSFMDSLKKASFHKNKSGLGVHGTTALVKGLNTFTKRFS
jgi:hypothetical protein